MRQTIRNRVRVFNKYVTNKVLIHICGKPFGHFAILSHTGRKSGRLYRTPIIAEPSNNGFVIALTYGKKVDWYANIMVKGTCSLYWKEKTYHLSDPELIDREIGLLAFPPLLRSALKKAGIEDFLMLSIQESPAQ